jgi:hypothetical protein
MGLVKKIYKEHESMKLKFINQFPKHSENVVKRFLKTFPEEKRLLIANMQWTGIIPEMQVLQKQLGLGLYKTLVGKDEKKFKEALALAPGKAWLLIEEETQNYLDDKMSKEEVEKYKKKLFETTYKDEPEKLIFLTNYFNAGEQNKVGFKQVIQDDIKESHAREYQKHLNYWMD